jgi:5-methylcytosine-specific restriction endonuclease McrA
VKSNSEITAMATLKVQARWAKRMKRLKTQWASTREGRIKLRMLREQDGLCSLCGKSMLDFSMGQPSLDHQIPKSMGGTWAQSNLKLAHAECNRQRSSTPIEVWRAQL